MAAEDVVPVPLNALFRRVFSEEPRATRRLKGDGSVRELYRMAAASSTVVGVWNPHHPQENTAFLSFTRLFRRHGLPVPAVRADDPGSGAYLEQDLGDMTLLAWLDQLGSRRWGEEALAVYRQVVSFLPFFQVVAGTTADWSVCYQGEEFDGPAMMRDLRYFEREFLEPMCAEHADLSADFERFVESLAHWPRDCFMYRDFQARNVMLAGSEPWFLDYQSGRRGPLPYDIASLLFDSAVCMPEEVRKHLLEVYLRGLGRFYPVDRDRFLIAFPGFCLLRILQALGAYGFLSRHRSKRHFLARVPTALSNLRWLRQHWPDQLPRLRSLWDTVAMLQDRPDLWSLR